MGSRAGHVADEGQDAIIDDVVMAWIDGKRLEPPSVIGSRNCFGVVGPTRASECLQANRARSGCLCSLGTRSRAEGDGRSAANKVPQDESGSGRPCSRAAGSGGPCRSGRRPTGRRHRGGRGVGIRGSGSRRTRGRPWREVIPASGMGRSPGVGAEVLDILRHLIDLCSVIQ